MLCSMIVFKASYVYVLTTLNNMAMNHCVRRFGGLRGFTVGATLLALIFMLS
jgi:hypothetical protein